MKRFFAKIGRFFWSWGFLKFVLAIIALIILFYVEEDWRGARAWAATKAEWEAKGESFDYNKFIPPPVPDDQNLAAIPLFKLEPAKITYFISNTTRMELTPVALKKAMRDDLKGDVEFPPIGGWQAGELPDMAKIRKTLASNYALAVKTGTSQVDSLTQFNAIYPFYDDFLAQAVTRPVFRFDSDYGTTPLYARSLAPVTSQIHLSKIITLHGILALDAHRPDLALEDLKINYEIMSGVKRDPSLVGGLVGIGLLAIGNEILYVGLVQHQWNDAQLQKIDEILKSQNLLADYQFAMRSEVMFAAGATDYLEKLSLQPRSWIYGIEESPSMSPFVLPWPGGWFEANKSESAEFRFQSLSTVDPKAHLVFSKVVNQMKDESDKARASWTSFLPWRILASVSNAPMLGATIKYSEAQVWVDEARIACALERYRLAHGVYPGSLDALAPACIHAIPHDIMNGQPYHYQLRPDGTYLLYSVGWNQTDDGGKVVYKKDFPTQIDYDQGDWVWPTPK